MAWRSRRRGTQTVLFIPSRVVIAVGEGSLCSRRPPENASHDLSRQCLPTRHRLMLTRFRGVSASRGRKRNCAIRRRPTMIEARPKCQGRQRGCARNVRSLRGRRLLLPVDDAASYGCKEQWLALPAPTAQSPGGGLARFERTTACHADPSRCRATRRGLTEPSIQPPVQGDSGQSRLR